MNASPAPGLPPAEQLFADFLESCEQGDEPDFEAVCAAHPAAADELRRIHARWTAISAAFRALSEEIAPAGTDAGPAGASVPLDALLARLRRTPVPGGRFALGPEIARGAMGRVVRAWDEDLRREVALKIQRDDRREPRMQRRFLEEAQIAGQLDHPGIVPIHELGIDAEGRPFFAMRLVRGRTLDEVLGLAKDGREGWSRTRVLHVVLRVCEAVAYAHDRGVVHRDLKPQNVMVGRYGETYVMDWGLAHAVGEHAEAVDSLRASIAGDDRGSPLLTQLGEVLGTPAYMAPEQASGGARSASRAVDVYAIGAILYEVGAGRPPYAEGGAPRSAREVLAEVRARPPAPLPEQVPPELRAIVDRAMARDPASRYATVQDLADDLRAFLELRVVRAYATGRYQELRKWIARNRALSAITAISAVLLVAASVASTSAWLAADRARAALDRTAHRLAAELERSKYREARLLLGTDNAAVAEDSLWGQHLAGAMPRATHWALVDAYERSPCVATVRAPVTGNAVACFVPGRHEIAIAGRDGSIRILDATTLAGLRGIAAVGSGVLELAATPDGASLLAGTEDGRLLILDATSGALRRGENAHGGALRAIAIGPDGRGIATGGGDGRVLLWSDHDAAPVQIAAHEAPVWSLAFLDDGSALASGDEAGHLLLTTLAAQGQRRWRLGDRNLMAIAPTLDGSRLFVGSVDQNLYLVDLDATGARRRIAARNGTVRDIARDRDGSMLVGGWWRIDRYPPDGSAARPVALRGTWRIDVDPAARRFVSTATTGLVSLFESGPGDRLELGGTNFALAGGGRRIAVHSGRRVRVLPLDRAAEPAEPVSFDGGGWLAIDRGATSIAVHDQTSRQVAVHDAATGALRFRTPGPDAVGSNECFAFAPDGSELATVVGRSRVERVDARSAAVRATYHCGDSALIRLRYVDGGSALLLLGLDPAAGRLIRLADGRSEELPVGGDPSVAALSGDGQRLAVADRSGRITVHDRRTGQRRELGGRTGTVWSLHFSPVDPGLLICSTRADGVTFWDLDSGEVCYRWVIDDGPITQVQISDDGATLAGYSTRGVVVRDLGHYERHVAGNLGLQLDQAGAASGAAAERAGELRAWADTVLGRSWPRFAPAR